MKQCTNCNKFKTLENFYSRGGSRSHQRQCICISCSKESSNSHKRFISSLVKRWKLKKGCQRCEFKAEHSVQLEIDHVIPRKKGGNHRQAINSSWSKKRLKQELAGCQVLCANCHRLKTYQDGTMFQTKEF